MAPAKRPKSKLENAPRQMKSAGPRKNKRPHVLGADRPSLGSGHGSHLGRQRIPARLLPQRGTPSARSRCPVDDPPADDTVINTALAGARCRCTGQQQIRMAVRAAAAPPPTSEAIRYSHAPDRGQRRGFPPGDRAAAGVARHHSDPRARAIRRGDEAAALGAQTLAPDGSKEADLTSSQVRPNLTKGQGVKV